MVATVERVVEKVTGFVTRWGADGARQVLVFEHDNPSAGIQLPAGTVEPAESPRGAVLREVLEETGLAGLRVVGEPERAPLELGDREVYLVEHPSVWHARGVPVASPVAELVAIEGGRVTLRARGRDGELVELRVAREGVTRDVRRWIFHLEVVGEAPDTWQRAHDTAQPWTFFWVGLDFGPNMRHRHRDWFEQMRARVARHSTHP